MTDTPAALEFLRRWRPGGPWVLTAISTDRTSIETRTFEGDEAGLEEWVEANNGQRNLYFSVNPTIGHVTKKADREQIASLDWLHVDIDPRAGEDLNEERERALSRLTTNLPAGVPRPTCVVFSGGGYQGFWRLTEPYPVDGDLAKAEEAKRWNQQLELLFAADNCHNIDRIMRLPGTVNIPDKKKLEKGRTKTLARVEFFEDSAYPLTDFTPAAQVQSPEGGLNAPRVKLSGNIPRLGGVDELDQWGVPDRVKVIVVQGSHPDEEPKPSRSEWLFDAVCNMVRAGVPDEVIFSIITDEDYGIADAVLTTGDGKRRSSAIVQKYATRQITQAHEHAVDPWMRTLNERHAVAGNVGGKCRVIEEVMDDATGRSRLTYQSFEDFAHRYIQKIQCGEDAKGNPRFMPVGKWWLQHSMRRYYDTVAFRPDGAPPSIYNLWKGFAVDAIPGDCGMFLGHLETNICRGSSEHFHYLLGWMARCVQQPAKQGEVAVVMRGPKGSGKSFFARQFGRLFGRHYLPISNAMHLLGNFNAHLADALVVFADEAFYAGDKKHESVLKTLITENTQVIERKGLDVEPMRNHIHLIMASNEDWVVPATEGERRFFVLDVSPEHQQDLTYFSAIDAQMRAGGYEALLHFLLNYDISEFQVRNVPQTDELQAQKALTLPPMEAWWLGRLQEGELAGREWPGRIPKLDIQNDWVGHAKDFNVTRRGDATRLGRFLRQVMPGELRVVKIDGRNGYELPFLPRARELWEEIYGEQEWPDVAASYAGEDQDLPF